MEINGNGNRQALLYQQITLCLKCFILPKIYAYQNASRNFDMFMAEHLGPDLGSMAGFRLGARLIRLDLDG